MTPLEQVDLKLFTRVNIDTIQKIKNIEVSSKSHVVEYIKNDRIESSYQFPIIVTWEDKSITTFYYKTQKAFEIAKAYIDNLYKELEQTHTRRINTNE